ncbi:hypothetical protein ACFE04_029774 [Oxalis oulophora]
MASLLLSPTTVIHRPFLLPTTTHHHINLHTPTTLSFSTKTHSTLSLSTTKKPLTITTAATTTTTTTTTQKCLQFIIPIAAFTLKTLIQSYTSSPPIASMTTFAASSLFFAALKDRPTGYLNTPLTVVAAGLAKWLDIYSGVLMVRVLLSWFPNIPWDRQPLSAIRDLCDPYLNLFRNIIPPIFDTLDVSPLLAFAVLGTLGSILNSTRGAY